MQCSAPQEREEPRLSCRLRPSSVFVHGWLRNVQPTRTTSVKNKDIVPFAAIAAYTPRRHNRRGDRCTITHRYRVCWTLRYSLAWTRGKGGGLSAGLTRRRARNMLLFLTCRVFPIATVSRVFKQRIFEWRKFETKSPKTNPKTMHRSTHFPRQTNFFFFFKRKFNLRVWT